MVVVKAIIMAGGEGTRLRPLTCNIPKPMMSIMEKPVLQYTIELLKKHGIFDIGITLQYLPDEIINYFGDGKDFEVNITYFIEENPLGTAGSVKNAEDFLDDTFIVISGDALTDIDITKAISFHKEKSSIITLVLKDVDVPLEYGVVVTDKMGRVTGFLEKPSWGEVFSDKVNTGIYILEPAIFKYFEKNLKIDFSNDLFPIALKENIPMFGYITEDYWCDIGNIEQYMSCQYDILNGLVNVKINGKLYNDNIWIGNNCEISDLTSIEGPAYIGSGTRIYENCAIGSYTIINKNNIISKGANIKRSIIFDNCYIGSNTEVKGAVLCKNVQLESRAQIFEAASIGDGTLIRQRAIIKPGIKIWPNKVIDSSTVVTSNIIWGGKSSKSLFGRNYITGEVNVDITPEFVSKLGSAYGSTLRPESKVAISCSDSGAAQMFKYALATGLLSMGIEVYDLQKITLSMARQATLFFGVKGSIHVSNDEEESQKVYINFLNHNGLNIDKTTERKIENSFLREDFRRVKSDEFKKITHLYDCIEHYSRNLVNQLAVHKIRNKKYKIVLSIKNSLLLNVVYNVLQEIGVSVKCSDDFNNLLGIRKEVIESNADLGIRISDEGEKAVLIDDKGNIIRGDLFDILNSYVTLKSKKISTLVVPVTASAAMEEIASICGAGFIRTKTSQNSILEEYIRTKEDFSRREIVITYLMSLDAVSVSMLLINLMAENGISLSSLIEKLPKYFSVKQDVRCPWNLKCKVMRSLIEYNTSNSSELIEGINFNFQNGWALVLPDSEEPVCRILAEAKNEDDAYEISKFIISKIQAITGIQE